MARKKTLLIILAAIFVIVVAALAAWYVYLRPADSSLAVVKEKGTLVVGSNIPFGVMEFFDENGQPAGIDVDIAREIASRLGVKLEFNNYDWDSLFSKVKGGEIDLAISGITITPERRKEVLFSDSYFNGGQVIVIRSDEQDIRGVSDLAGRRIAVQKDTTGYEEAKKHTPETQIVAYLNFDSTENSGIVYDLKAGKFDVIIVDYIQALDMIKHNSGLKIVGVPFTREEYGIIARIGNDSLVQEINSILKKMVKDGTMEKITAKWTLH